MDLVHGHGSAVEVPTMSRQDGVIRDDIICLKLTSSFP